MSLPRLALVACLRDEAEILPAFLAYHRALGVERLYAYPDRCRDNSVDILKAAPWVEIVDKPRTTDQRSNDIYQMACADDALALARQDGFDWLLHLDADEFAWGDNTPLDSGDPLAAGHLPTTLARAKASTLSIRFRVLEAVIVDPLPSPFWKNHLMQDGDFIKRNIFDPTTGKPEPLTKLIGHKAGKAAARVSADLQTATVHRWTARQDVPVPEILPIAEETLGWHYHYLVRSPENWVEKYKKFAEFADVNSRGNQVLFPKRAWKIVAKTYSHEAALRYFAEWVAVPQHLVEQAQAQGFVRRHSHVERVLDAIGFRG